MITEVGKRYKRTHKFSFIHLFISLPNTIHLLSLNSLFVDSIISCIFYTKALLRTYCILDTFQGKEGNMVKKSDEDSYLPGEHILLGRK